MIELDEIGRRAIEQPPVPPSPIEHLEDRRSQRSRNRTMLRAGTLVVALLVAVGIGTRIDLFDSGAGEAGVRVTTDGAVLEPEVPEAAEEQPTDGAVPTTATESLSLGVDGYLFPDEPMPLADLIERFGTEVLEWSDGRWVMPENESSLHFIQIEHMTRPERNTQLIVEKRGSGWVVIEAGTLGLQPIVEDEMLVGFASNRDTSAVVRPGEQQTFDLHFATRDGGGFMLGQLDDPGFGLTIELPEPVTAQEAGTFLAVGRDQAGEATVVGSQVMGFPDRLTAEIDSLFELPSPAEYPAQLIDAYDPTTEHPALRRDYGRARKLEWVEAGVKAWIVPTASGGVCLEHIVEDPDVSGWASSSSCVSGSMFNQSGHYNAVSRGDDESTVFLLPDSLEFGDIGASAQLDFVGHAIQIDEVVHLTLDQFDIVDGVANLRDD